MRNLSSAFLACFFAFNASATNVYINAAVPQSGDGTKDSPFKTLNEALNVAEEGDVIYMASGTYLPALNENDARKSTFEITKGIIIKGGYNESFSIANGTTVLSGDLNGDDVYDENGRITGGFEDNCYRVVRTMGEAGDVTIENVTIKGGYANGEGYNTGGGMMIQGKSVTLKQVTLSGNFCSGAGGGAIHVRTNLKMDNCILSGNQGGGDGGALFINGEANIKIQNSVFKGNKSTSGAAIFHKHGISFYLSGNTFMGNEAQTYGTVTLYNKNEAGDFVIVNNTLVNNRVAGNVTGKTLLGGSALYTYLKSDANVYLVNNTIMGNSVDGRNADESVAPQLGGAIFARQGNIKLANNVIAGNTSSSTLGDMYRSDGVITSLFYNLYTSYDNMDAMPDRYDLVAGETYNGGVNKLMDTFDATMSSGVFTANAVMNGGPTPTVKVVNADTDFDGLTIRSVPITNLQEETIGADLTNDGDKTGILKVDQRGYLRSLTGNATIGVYEVDGVPTGISIVTDKDSKIKIYNNELIVNTEKPYTYWAYDSEGQLVHAVKNIFGATHLPDFNPGIYVIKVTGTDFNETIKARF